MTGRLNFKTIARLSASLDGELPQAEAARLEAELREDASAAAALQMLAEARSLLQRLPHRRAPRNFTLRPGMAGLGAPTPRLVPALRLTAVLASVLLAVSLSLNLMAPLAASAPMVYGMGGGAEGMPVSEAAAEQPVDDMQAEATPSLEPIPDERVSATEQVNAPVLQAPPPASGDAAPAAAAWRPADWQIGLAAIALLAVLTAGALRWRAQAAFQKRLKK